MEIPLTFLCNNNCISCIINSKAETVGHLSWSEIKQRIDRLPKSIDTVGITGGEPTTSKNFFKTMSYLKKTLPDTLIFLVTNGRMFSYPDFAKRLAGLNIKKMRVGIAIYSHDPEIHDSITMSKGSWQQTIDGIKNLLSLGVVVELRIIINKLNYTFLDETSRFITKNIPGVERVVFINMKYTGNAFRNRKTIFVNYKDIIPHVTKAVDVLTKNNLNTKLFHFPLCILPKKYRNIARGITKQMADLAFAEKCDSCKSKKDCPMIWKTYLVLAGGKEFNPI